ncbi:zf-HC2 domain-containing protein [Candidatus Stoquefichus massiliensis]|uniref:zf-HC2 domain-containing protein n=1 Tax=Candidatus Stoquefichus massiliensis TaxID=1470350 RepID=UPI000484D609|nr:zf-HC2 domain-containing protein [Candidatus Stoquefichus massiliensis]
MSKECRIVRDLIPLVNDGVASQESQEFVEMHCLTCSDCRALLDELPDYNEKNMNEKWNKKLKMTWLGFIALMILIATSFSETQYQFHNFILVPLIGGLGYLILRRKVYILYIFVLISQMIIALLQQGLHSVLLYIIIYWFLLSIGIIIGACFRYALSGRDKNEV